MLLALAAIVFWLLSKIPFGNTIQWPFIIITTFIHEMGHGLSALLVGGDFIKVEIFHNASGLAYTRTSEGWHRAFVAAGGLIAPSVAGGIFLWSGLNSRRASISFLILSIFILISCLLWVRSSFGLMILIPAGLIFLFLSRKSSKGLQHFLIQFIGVHMLVDTFTRTLSYIFTSTATVSGEARHSDTGVIAESLIGGHLLWACIMGLVTVGIVIISLRKTYFK